MDKFRYTFTSTATGLKDLTVGINKKQFDTMREHLHENVNDNKNAVFRKTMARNGLYRETSYYFEFKNEKTYVLYILTVREAEEGCYFI